ncbi:TonB-dependent receptor [Methylobacillus sp. Pita1]
MNKPILLSLAVSLIFSPASGMADTIDSKENGTPVKELPLLEVQASRIEDPAFEGQSLSSASLARRRLNTNDTARLLEDIPGVSTYGAGGISSLPTIHGFADDRIRTQVDGMDLMSACPNHMNPALSYMDPSNVETVQVYAGITPVSVGGDSIGGTIQVSSAKPKFAKDGEDLLVTGKLGTFYRSNGAARGGNVALTLASQNLSLTYTDSYSQANNYRAAGDFKKPGGWNQQNNAFLRPFLDSVTERTVAGTAYRGSRHRELSLGWKIQDNHLFELKLGEQSLDWEGFPNQRMDMVSSEPDPGNPGNFLLNTKKPANVNRTANLHYTGQFGWGELEMRYFHQNLEHSMDMLPHRYIGMMMPMLSEATTDGSMVKANIALDEQHSFNIGTDFQFYRLDDWWPGIGLSANSMCCNDFWNIRDGKRDRIGVFSEWEAKWSSQWTTLLGIRTDRVKSNTGPVQGYSSGSYQADANAFNALNRSREDYHYDLTALSRFTPDDGQSYEFGFARKTRSPNLYERYPWSRFAMAALMNNFVGDGNGYIGNPDLKPEIAYTISASGDWHDANKEKWQVKTTGYLTYVENYIDAVRLPGYTRNDQYMLLQYANADARLYGLDVSGSYRLGSIANIGSFAVSGMFSYVRGENRATGDNLYHMMPLNGKFALEHKLGSWTNTLEMQRVTEKDRISQVRNEITTPGYTLFNLRSSLEWQSTRLDLSVENLFNRFYYLPLGGAYLAQGNAMTTNGIPWGMGVPGRGRSVNIALSYSF